MGRLARLAGREADEHAFALQHCEPDGAGGASCTTLRADGTRNATRFAALPPHVPTRARANKKRSRRCGGCDAHHEMQFVNRDGSETPLGAGPGQQPLSVGRPVKLSTARLLAAHLRRAVCGGKASCPELLATLDIPLADWTRHRFLAAALRPPAPPPNVTAAAPHDSALWARPWAWCAKDGACSGRVERADWLDPRTRGHTCKAAITQAASEGALHVHFCTVDAQSESTCANVARWQLEISTILCRALGFAECQERAHVYSPTTYSVSNGEFVHDTVRAFYENSVQDSTCATDLSADELKQKLSNDNLKERCASTSLVPLRTALRKLREIKTLAIELIFYMSSAGSQVLCVRLCVRYRSHLFACSPP